VVRADDVEAHVLPRLLVHRLGLLQLAVQPGPATSAEAAHWCSAGGQGTTAHCLGCRRAQPQQPSPPARRPPPRPQLSNPWGRPHPSAGSAAPPARRGDGSQPW
jgi:hypothetical protein